MAPKKQAEPQEEIPQTGSGKFIFNSPEHYYEGEWKICLPEPDPADKKKKNAPQPTEEELQQYKKRHGKGTYVFNNVTYVGEWDNDNMHGNGKLTFANGDEYEGQFENGFMKGSGKFVWGSGAWYEGHFENNRMHGKGLYVSADGRRFHGTFYNGLGPGLQRELIDEESSSVIKEKKRLLEQEESQPQEETQEA